jgi:hypothetical protein
LDDEGVLVMNVIASPTDERARFFDALMASITRVFPEAAVFSVAGEGGPLQNTSIIAAKRPGTDLERLVAEASTELAATRIDGYVVPVSTTPLTDDFAPVDQYLLGL